MSAVESRQALGDRFAYVSVNDPLAKPLFEELAHEYRSRYGEYVPVEELNKELLRYPGEYFAAPDGAFLLLLREGHAIAGGAFMRHKDDATAEFKRIWASSTHRRQGLARRVLSELEAQASRQGYTRICLGTGPRQPEAVGLYLSTGYTMLSSHDFGEAAQPGVLFEKHLQSPRRTASDSSR